MLAYDHHAGCCGSAFVLQAMHGSVTNKHRVDRNGKGYLMHSDWGAKEYHNVVELFSLMYMQKFMGLPTQNSTLEQVWLVSHPC